MWYVMQVYTGTEMEICERCRARIMEEGEDIFVPLAERMTKVRGQRTMVTTRLFPGYVFVETDRSEDFYARLRQMDVMAKVLKVGERMVSVYPEEEAWLRQLCGGAHVAEYSEGYIEGDTLIITSGALKAVEGKVKKLLRHKRLVVMEIQLMGQNMEVTLGLGVVSRQGTGMIREIRMETRQVPTGIEEEIVNFR